MSSKAVDLFAEVATEHSGMKMYPLNVHNNVSYEKHTMSHLDDVQILCRERSMDKTIRGHVICIHYEASTKKVNVYDSGMFDILDEKQKSIIKTLYPYNTGTDFKRPKTVQVTYTCGLFAMMYATMLLLKKDPAEFPIKLNEVAGDQTLYMRMHVLNMLVRRKLALME